MQAKKILHICIVRYYRNSEKRSAEYMADDFIWHENETARIWGLNFIDKSQTQYVKECFEKIMAVENENT